MKDWAISSEKRVYDELAYTIGFFLGDGSLSTSPFRSSVNGKTYFHNDVVFVCSDLEPIERVSDQLERVFGRRPAMTTRTIKSGSLHYRVSTHRRDVFNFFAVNTEWKTKVPTYYFSAEPEVQKEVLRGLMDSDGHCAEYKDGKVKRWMLGFSNTKRGVIEDCASLFQKAGVKVGVISEGNKKGYKPTYIIHPNMRSFHEAGMFFYASRKQEKFDRYVDHVLRSETTMAAPLT